MPSVLRSRLVLAPLLAFVLGLAGTSGLSLWAAEGRSGRKAEKSAAKGKAEAPAAPAGAPLSLKVDAKPINRDAPERVSYSAVVRRTAGSVVYVYSSKVVRSPELPPYLNDPRLRRFFEEMLPRGGDEDEAPGNRAPRNNNRPPRNRGSDQTQQGLGSGVVITADGYIVTNHHVIDGADDVSVSLGESNRRYTAKVVGRDPGTDLAVLKIEAENLSPATFADSDQVEVGDMVLAIGNPFGVGQSVSRGIVSALSRGMGMGVFEDFIQTDAAINPGNSGGALVDVDGRLVGINTAILSRNGGFQGVGLAVPANMVSHVAESLVKSGKVSRGYLGITLQGITANLKESLELKSNQGALVSDVVAGSPAAKAGLKEGDVILALNGKTVTDSNNLRIQVSSFAPGTKLSLEVLRNGDTKTISATTGERPGQGRHRKTDTTAPALDDEGVLNGVAVDDITPKHREQFNIPARIKGAVITNVDPASPSAKAGLRAGDVILEINKRPVTNAEEAVELSTKADTKKTLVRLYSRGNTVFVVVDETDATAGQ